jgi:hypothetical protein
MKKVNIIIVAVVLGLFSFLSLSSFGLKISLVLPISIGIGALISAVSFKFTKNLKSTELFLVCLFLGIIFLPLFSKKETESFEKRPLAAAPVFNPQFIWGYFFEFQKYYEDRFAFRNTMMMYYAKTKLNLFKSSPLPAMVGIGKEDWLYFTSPLLIKESQQPFTPQELKQIKLNLRLITAWLKSKDITYYFLLLPFKQRIYPEYQNALIAHQFKFSKIDQLYDFIQEDTLINCIDVRKNLVEGKEKYPTYIKTDTHWTEWGAYLTYLEIFKKMKQNYPSLEPNLLSEFIIDTSNTGEGDLQLMMGLKDDIMFPYYNINLKNEPEIQIIDSSATTNPSSKYSIRELKEKNKGLKIFVVRDSFTEYLRKFLTPHFDRSFYAWMPVMPAAKIVEEKPNIVLQEMLEQFIHHTLELPLEIQQDTAFLKQNLKRLAN